MVLCVWNRQSAPSTRCCPPVGFSPRAATGFCGDTREYSTAADSVARMVAVSRACDCADRPTSVAGFGGLLVRRRAYGDQGVSRCGHCRDGI